MGIRIITDGGASTEPTAGLSKGRPEDDIRGVVPQRSFRSQRILMTVIGGAGVELTTAFQGEFCMILFFMIL